jgi:hypothetical protein
MEEIKAELRELLKAINICNDWSADKEKAKAFKDKTIDEFVSYRIADYTNQLHRLVRELEGK